MARVLRYPWVLSGRRGAWHNGSPVGRAVPRESLGTDRALAGVRASKQARRGQSSTELSSEPVSRASELVGHEIVGRAIDAFGGVVPQ